MAPAQTMVDRSAFAKMLVKSRADSTAKKYLVEIRRFLAWCKQNSVADSYPFSSSVVTLYLFQLLADQHKSYSVLVMVHAALKWFHSFVPINAPNPLDDACAKNVIESAKRRKGNPIVKKEPISTDLLSKYCPVSILLRYMHEAKLTPRGDLPLFSPLSKTKSGYRMRASRLSYSRCREVFM